MKIKLKVLILSILLIPCRSLIAMGPSSEFNEFTHISSEIHEEMAPNIKLLLKLLPKKLSNVIDSFYNYSLHPFVPINVKQTYENILRGAVLNYGILNNNQAVLNYFSSDRNKAARDLMWFYFAIAASKNQAFAEGTFLIQGEPAEKVLSFLSNGAYTRRSTHFTALMKYTGTTQTHYGLDIDNMPPGDKNTILFGKVDDEKRTVFIKPEDAGTQGLDLARHAVGVMASLIRKSFPYLDSLTKGGYSEVLTDYLKYYVKTDDEPEYRKERIPSDVLRSYADILSQLTDLGLIDSAADRAYLDKAVAWGIQKMYQQAGVFKSMVDEDKKQNVGNSQRTQSLDSAMQEINQFIQHLENNFDHLTIRFGREVVLDINDLAIVTKSDAQEIARALNMTGLRI